MILKYRPAIYRGDKLIAKAHWGFSVVWSPDEATRRLVRRHFADQGSAVAAANAADLPFTMG